LPSDKQVNPPDLSTVLNDLKLDILKSINCVQVGIVQSFDSADQTASVRLVIKKVLSINKDGTRVLQERPVLLKVPAIILSGGQAGLTFPITTGDECVVLFNDREIDNWFISGDVRAPSTVRTHDLSDGIALVGLRSIANSLSEYLTDGVRLFFGTKARIDVKDDLIDSRAEIWQHEGLLRMKEGDTTPALSGADLFQMYAADIVAGNKAPHFETELGQIIKLFSAVTITNPTGGIVIDIQARTAIDAILLLLKSNGLML